MGCVVSSSTSSLASLATVVQFGSRDSLLSVRAERRKSVDSLGSLAGWGGSGRLVSIREGSTSPPDPGYRKALSLRSRSAEPGKVKRGLFSGRPRSSQSLRQ